jgi:fatty-acyl-CoA synthase
VGVPTVWLNLLNHLRDTGKRPQTLKHIMVGGAAMPRALMLAYAEMGIQMRQGWGMTESSPIVTVNMPKPSCLKMEGEAQLTGAAPRDGWCSAPISAPRMRAARKCAGTCDPGQCLFRGHWIASGYFRMPQNNNAMAGFPPAMSGVIDKDGFLTLTDRSKDLIKSGGNGSAPSPSKISPSPIPMWPKPPPSPCRMRNGASGRS